MSNPHSRSSFKQNLKLHPDLNPNENRRMHVPSIVHLHKPNTVNNIFKQSMSSELHTSALKSPDISSQSRSSPIGNQDCPYKLPLSELRKAMPHKHSDPYVPGFQLPKPLMSLDNKNKNKNKKKYKKTNMPFLVLPESIKSTGRGKAKNCGSIGNSSSSSYSSTASTGR